MTRAILLLAAVILSLAAFALGWDTARQDEQRLRAERQRRRLQPSRN